MQKGSPLAALQDQLKQAESALQTRKRETDMQTITHLSEMENELSEAYDQKDQFELKLKTQSAELMALRERHQAAMSNSLQLERNASSLHEEIAELKSRLAQAEKQSQPERAVQVSSALQQTITTPRRQPEASAQQSSMPRQAPVMDSASRRQVDTHSQNSPVQYSPQQVSQAKSTGLFKSGSLLRKKKSQPRSEDSNLAIAPDQFEQYVSGRPSMDSSRLSARPSMDVSRLSARPSMDSSRRSLSIQSSTESVRASMDTIRPAGDQASTGSSTGSVRRKSSLMQRFRHSIRRSTDNFALESSPSVSTSSIVSQSDSPPPAVDRRRSVELQTRSEIPRPTNRLVTIPSGNILTHMTASDVEEDAAPSTAVGTSYTRPSSRDENSRPASRTAQASRLPQPEGSSRRSSTSTPEPTASSLLISTNPSTPARAIAARSSSPPLASPILALRKPAEERDRERYHPHTPQSRVPSTGISPKSTLDPAAATGQQQQTPLNRTSGSPTTFYTPTNVPALPMDVSLSPTVETPSELEVEFAVAATSRMTPMEVDVHSQRSSSTGLAQAATSISPPSSGGRKSLDRAKERRELSLAERQSLRMNGGK